MVKEAASLKKNNLFADSTDLQCVSQSSLADSRTPPLSAPSSPPLQAVQKISSPAGGTVSEDPHQTHETSVIPTVKITVSSPESVEPTSPLHVCESQPDVPPTSPDNASPILEVTETDVSSTKPETIVCAEDSSEMRSKVKEDDVTPVGSDQAPDACETVEADEESKDASAPQSEIKEECVHTVQPEASQTINAEVLPDERVEGTDVDASVSDEHSVDNKVCEATPSSDEKSNETQDSPAADALDSVPDGPEEGAVALTSELENHSIVNTDSEEETADSVHAIRDLIMEVIEVEDIIRPCNENQP